jgi:hypothetical protein
MADQRHGEDRQLQNREDRSNAEADDHVNPFLQFVVVAAIGLALAAPVILIMWAMF